jgi:AraC-like DNA-binding protein
MRVNLNHEPSVKSHRKMESISEGTFLIEDALEIHGTGSMTFVMSDKWLFQLFQIDEGEFYFQSGKKYVRPRNKRFGIFYPPFSVMEACFQNIHAHWRGIASDEILPNKLLARPRLFQTEFRGTLESVADVVRILDTASEEQSIEKNPVSSMLSVKAKRILDETYRSNRSIAAIAKKLGVTHPHLSRQFKRDYGLTPNAYSHQLRIAAAMFKLARGEEILDVSADVGYGDPGRFYKQFSKSKRKAPGYCRDSARTRRNR